MAVMIFDQPAEALTSKLAKGLSYIAEQSGNNWILPTGTNAVSGDFISVDGIMGQAATSIVGGTDAIVEGTNWSQCPSGALNALNSKVDHERYVDITDEFSLMKGANTTISEEFYKVELDRERKFIHYIACGKGTIENGGLYLHTERTKYLPKNHGWLECGAGVCIWDASNAVHVGSIRMDPYTDHFDITPLNPTGGNYVNVYFEGAYEIKG